ncbi:MAG: energy transducer TonB, partial [Blastocatellia bacterium]
MQNKDLFSDAFFVQPSLLRRLLTEASEASREFRKDPSGFIKTAMKGDGLGGRGRKTLLRFGLALGVMAYALVFAVILVVWILAHRHQKMLDDNYQLVHIVNPDDFKIQPSDAPKADKRGGGGGGGGRNTPTPPSKGVPPPMMMKDPIITPRPEPRLKPPDIAMPEFSKGPPQPRLDDISPTGLLNGVPGPPAPGPGSGGGIGTGTGGGVGSGNGIGQGPGNRFGRGGGEPGGGGNGPVANVDTLPVPLNRPRPNYTEEARKNKVQGLVRAKALVGADGRVKDVRVVTHLPDGLDEQAIQAVYQINFRPATRAGQPVAHWVT